MRNARPRNRFDPVLRLRSLGELGLSGPAGELLPGRRKELALLVYLARRSPRPVRRAELAALLWESRDEKRAEHSLRQALLTLKRSTGGGFMITPQAVALERGVVELDLSTFDDALATGRMVEAVGYWKGDFLVGLEDVGGETCRAWIDAERERARRGLARALDGLVEEADAAGDRAAALRWAEQWTELLPFDEAAARQMVEQLEFDGRLDEARAFYAEFTTRLKRELGIDPSPEITSLGDRLNRMAGAAAGTPSVRQAGSAALFSPDFVGREAARSELRSAWGTVADGGAAVVLVQAEEGMGKTLLCDEFLRTLADDPARPLVLRMRAREERSQIARSSARELLAGLVTAPGLLGAATADLAELSRLLPAIRDRCPELPGLGSAEPILGGAVARVLASVAEDVPVVLFVDDLGHADVESRELVVDIVRAAPSRVLCLLTIGADGGSGDADALAVLRHVPGVRRLKLPPLQVTELELVLGSMLVLPTTARRTLAARLHRETGGNPLYASEVLGAMVDDGHLTQDASGIWSLDAVQSGQLPLPSTVREAVLRRLNRLGDPARRIAETATQLDEPIDPARLAEATGLNQQVLQDGLYELLATRLVRYSAVAPEAIEFVHPIIRRVARERWGWQSTRAAPPGSRRWSRVLVIGGAATAVLATGLAVVGGRGTPEPVPTLAVGVIEHQSGASSDDLGFLFRDVLATSLAGVRGLGVISSVRMYEILGHLEAPPAARGANVTAARLAGADQLLEGTLRSEEFHGLRLELWRVDLGTGQRRDSVTVEGSGPFELADRATVRVAAAFGIASDAPRVADVTTSSAQAYRLYEEGLRSYTTGDYVRALERFEGALAVDSLFGMAALYAWRTANVVGRPPPIPPARLSGLATRAPDRERLLIGTAAAHALNDPSFVALAETLSVRYPAEPEGHLMLGIARIVEGDFLNAVPSLRQVIAQDSLGLRRTGPRCRACEAFAFLASAYSLADSAPTAEGVAREWMRLQPTAPESWRWIGTALAAQGRHEEAATAFRTAAAASQPDHPSVTDVLPLHVRMLAEDYTAIDSLLVNLIRNGTVDQQRQARWYRAISLRNQGRPAEALEILRQHEAEFPPGDPGSRIPTIGHRAQVLYELGRFAEAARVFDSLATFPPATLAGGQLARHKSWYLVHLATAAAAARDTSTVRSLLDPLRNWGQQSAYGRDRLLHHHARALLLAARGDRAEAAAEFRRAIYSPTFGYTRTNHELARALLALQRPQEAAEILESALRGAVDGPNLYITRTELHELLGTAYIAARHPDRAAFHMQRVLVSWRNAEAPMVARREAVREALEALPAPTN